MIDVSARIIVVVGNPKSKSRTMQVAEAVAERVARASNAHIAAQIDLCDYASELFSWPNEELAGLSSSVADADIVIVASPTYKASYTGMLKAFLDRYPNNGLLGTTAVPVMTASDPVHGLAVESTLRPLLVELGASVPTRGLFFLIHQIAMLDQVVDEWADVNLTNSAILGPLRRIVPQ